MTIPLQFTSLYNSQEVFVWSDCALDLGTDFLVDNMVSVGLIETGMNRFVYNPSYARSVQFKMAYTHSPDVILCG